MLAVVHFSRASKNDINSGQSTFQSEVRFIKLLHYKLSDCYFIKVFPEMKFLQYPQTTIN